MKEIKLPSGHVCQVDDIDYGHLMQFKWFIWIGKTNTYARTCFNLPDGKRSWVYMHRMIMPNTKEVDHKDKNGLNNTRNNLRAASRSDNMKNRAIRGSSRYRGVSRHLNYCWLAKINIDGKQKHLGCFRDEMEAARAYDKAAIATAKKTV